MDLTIEHEMLYTSVTFCVRATIAVALLVPYVMDRWRDGGGVCIRIDIVALCLFVSSDNNIGL